MENRNIRFCQDCGRAAVRLTGPDKYMGPGCGIVPAKAKDTPTTTNFHKFIATRYCETCAERHRREFAAKRQQRHRKKHKAEKMVLRRSITVQKKINLSVQRQLEREQERRKEAENAAEALRREIRHLQAQLQDTAAAEYRRGRTDEMKRKGGLVGLVSLFRE